MRLLGASKFEELWKHIWDINDSAINVLSSKHLDDRLEKLNLIDTRANLLSCLFISDGVFSLKSPRSFDLKEGLKDLG